MIRGVMDESGEQFVAYFLPTEETMEKRAKDFTEGKEYDDEQVMFVEIIVALITILHGSNPLSTDCF